jgi:hypothetical protein
MPCKLNKLIKTYKDVLERGRTTYQNNNMRRGFWVQPESIMDGRLFSCNIPRCYFASHFVSRLLNLTTESKQKKNSFFRTAFAKNYFLGLSRFMSNMNSIRLIVHRTIFTSSFHSSLIRANESLLIRRSP